MAKAQEKFMLRCFELADMGKYSVSPNPRVGAVVVHQGKIIGEGFHQKYGGHHAEVNAIHSVKNQDLLKDSELYVNLEPCSHYGKTPPCSDLIIQKGIPQVILANQDPFESVNGSGIEKLKNAGIEVLTGFMEKEGREINKRFFVFHEKKRPYIILKWAQTKDHFISRFNEDPLIEDNWITSPLSKQLVHDWRAEEDGILVGKKTVLVDNPSLTCREVKGKSPTRIILDSKLEIDTSFHVFKGDAKTIIFNEKQNGESKNLSYIKVKDLTQLPEVLNSLHQNQIQSLIVEGGAMVLKSFIEAGYWDEARVFTGDKLFDKGIKSPEIPAQVFETRTIGSDTLEIFKNVSL